MFRTTFLLILLFVSSVGVRAQEIQIGAILQLSGSNIEWGMHAAEGADLAVEELNRSSYLQGRKIKIIYEDGKGLPNESVLALRRLLSLHNIKSFITQSSNVSVALKAISNSRKIIQMDVGSTTPAYRQDRDYTFRTAVTALQLGAGIANELIAEKVKESGIFYVNDDFGLGMRNTFVGHYIQHGGKLVVEESFTPEDNSFAAQLLRLKRFNLSAIVVAARYDKMGYILRRARELGISSSFFSDVYGMESEQVLRIAGQAAEGVAYVVPKYSMDSSPVAARFAASFKKKYGKPPVQLNAQSYDGVFSLVNAFKACPEEDSECLRQAMEKQDFQGAAGRIQYDSAGDVIGRLTSVKVVKGGRFVECPENCLSRPH